MRNKRLKARKLKLKWSQYSAEYRRAMIEALNQLADENSQEEAAAAADRHEKAEASQ